MKMNVMKAGMVIGIAVLAMSLAGCPANTIEDATQLTVGDRGITAILRAGDLHWYKVELEEGRMYDYILKHDDNEAAVGLVFTVYLSDEEEQHLIWQRHLPPAGYDQLSDETVVTSKMDRVVPGFLAPEDGLYLISIEGYQQDDGRQQRNTYAYSNTLVYSIAVKYTPTAQNPQGAEISVSPQTANAPYVTNMIEEFETVYHPVQLERGRLYQLQARPGDIVAPVWWSTYQFESAAMYWSPPYDGEFYIRVDGGGADFGYVEYGVRVQEDIHGQTVGTATEAVPGDFPLVGYLGQNDVDFFEVVLPERDVQRAYRFTIEDRQRFLLNWNDPVDAVEWDDDGDVAYYEIIVPADTERTVRFSVVTTGDYNYLNDQADGAGAYEISLVGVNL